VQALGGAKNHMVIMPDADLDMAASALMGAAFGSAGERCMAISVAVPVTDAVADALVDKLAPKIAELEDRPSTDSAAEMGPLVTQEHLAKVKGYVDQGERRRREDRRRRARLPRTKQGYENGFFMGGTLIDMSRLT
jgi:malonate-semialdehyde dehydrogenase (acetylating)/methylmalonate-semialdehyde dehydrogenase